MPKKGITNNPNGRPKGSPNKSTDMLRQTVQTFLEKNMDSLQNNFDSLEPKDKLLFIEKMLKMVLPQPLNELERLTDEQLDQLILKLKNDGN